MDDEHVSLEVIDQDSSTAMKFLSKAGVQLRAIAKRSVPVQMRLSTLLMAILCFGIVLSWGLDHVRLRQEIKNLRHELSQQEMYGQQNIEKSISAFVLAHHGDTGTSDRGLYIDLHDTFVGNTELNRIREYLKRVDETNPKERMPLLLYGTRVTQTFARELQSELPHWNIVMTRPTPEAKK